MRRLKGEKKMKILDFLYTVGLAVGLALIAVLGTMLGLIDDPDMEEPES